MTSVCRTRRKHWSWLTLIWLGAFLMLGALTLPIRAAMPGFIAPMTPGVSGMEGAADRARATLTTQGYVVANVGLGGDGVMAGVIMQPASRALDAVAWQQIQAGWQALAEAYPQATWLLSGYGNGGRYLVCFLAPATNPQISAGQMGVYDTLLGRWVQRKDFAHKAFGTPARSGVFLTPIPVPESGTEPVAATVPNASLDDLSDRSAEPCFLPALDQITSHIAMRVESRQRWLTDSESALVARWHLAPASNSEATASPPSLSCRPHTPAAYREGQADARWRTRAYPADAAAQEAGEDPAGDPPPTTRPLLSPHPTPNISLSPHTSCPLFIRPDLAVYLRTGAVTTSLIPQHLLAWPTLRVRPPPHIAISR